MTTRTRTRTRKAPAPKPVETDAAGEDPGVAPADVPGGQHLTEAEWFASQEPADPVPNVQAETLHASLAPEDVRDAEVSAPKPEIPKGAHVEAYGSTVWECSEGDFVSRAGAEAVEAHIEASH